jgi:EAL domain-containing protein (putative c-di-GMP-specific phosphodiesterase class I)
MFDVDEVQPRLAMLKALGVRIAIDDFGTGSSSLAHLRQLPIDILKIDRSFVTAMTDSPEAAALVHTLVQLCKVLELTTVAKGIETQSPAASVASRRSVALAPPRARAFEEASALIRRH